MGCDIHLFVEKRVYRYDDKEHKNPVWVNIDKWTRDESVILYPEDYKDTPESFRGWTIDYHDRLYSDRNYDLFAIFANVRNGRGFAGVKTGRGFNPIAMPKGLPADVSEIVKAESAGWDLDGHSHSWLTLKELMEYDWEQTTEHTGWVGEDGYKVFKEHGEPDRWSGRIGGFTVRHIDNDEMDRIISGEQERGTIKHNDEELEIQYVTQISFEKPYSWSCKYFLEDVLLKMKEMVNETWSGCDENEDHPRPTIDTADGLRLVFWFDN